VSLLLSLLGWLTGSRVGRIVGIVVLAIAGGLLAWRIARSSGERAAELAQQQASLENLQSRVETDDEIRRLDPVQRRARLREWATRKPV